jgi:ribosome maturation factor RimP
MMDSKTLEEITALLRENTEKMGLELVSVKYLTDSENGPTLQVFIDKDFQITLADIEAYTEKVSPLLDDCEGLLDSYVLDISSGGSERELSSRDVPRLIGKYLDITLLKSGETITAKVTKATAKDFTVLRFVKGRKKEETIRYEDVKTIHMGYKA